ncbi:hypothetical protein BJ508DRAFT_325422 [Ascobolus immersus RN42]|uniref:Ty3 transposon capsid-like protein domain-containing protein n=1 Tax=Ascobolus immersus RN42 TaxID=1160509 RepID=A0A3N4I8L1_ASCIM|nr:hypothetical protein BJ508DRAFT_325422 [Ascobolus immersus RN42]
MSRPGTPVKQERLFLDLKSPRRGTPAAIPATDDDADYKVQVFSCTSSNLDPASVPPPKTHDEAFAQLLTVVGRDNDDMDSILWDYVESIGASATDGPDILEAINRQFDLIRLQAKYAAKAYDDSRKQIHGLTTRITQFEESRKKATAAHEEESNSLHREIEALQTQLALAKSKIDTKTTTTEPFDLPEWLRSKTTPTTSFEIPKALRLPLQSNPITAFDGTGDTEIVFKFIKDLDHHVKLLRDDFTDSQLIKYAFGYLTGSVLDWALDWRAKSIPLTTTWTRFFQDFKAKYVSQNAHIYLTNKLERMEFKASAIDAFNHEYKSTLQLLDLAPQDIGESNQYYQIYVRKIRDANILMAIQQLSFTTPLHLSTVMDYTSRLIAVKLASQPLRTHLPAASKPASPQTRANQPFRTRSTPRRPQPQKANNVEVDDDYDDLNALRAQRARSPPRCFACDFPDHLVPDCELKADWDSYRRQKLDTPTTGKD